MSAVQSDSDPVAANASSAGHGSPTSVAELLELQPITSDRFLAGEINTGGRRRLYGGQVAAQALRAASLTVPEGRVAHSIHGYFLRGGDAGKPITLDVDRDRDGGRYSARRVTASQDDSVIFSMACSFTQPQPYDAGYQAVAMPDAQAPEDLEPYQLDVARTFDLEARIPEVDETWHLWPPRLWVRIRNPLGDDPNLQACGVVFVSDLSTGLSLAPQIELVGIVPSIDHAVWLHRPGLADQWLLIDMHPLVTGAGRGVYTGQLYDREGTLVASLAQETLFDVNRRTSKQ